MDAPLYDIYLTGKLADNVSPAIAAQRLATLFKSTPETMAGLITGKAQLLKRGVDKNTALKYRDALQNAGCEVAFKAQTTAATETSAAMNAAPSPTPAAPNSGLQLAPVGEDLLRPNEHATVTAVVVATEHLSLAPVGPLPAIATPSTAAPDISQLSLASAGGNLLEESERTIVAAITPDIAGLSLAEAGAPLETLKSEAAPLHPDTSGLQLAPVGSDMLTPEQRRHPQSPPPNTDHIKLAP